MAQIHFSAVEVFMIYFPEAVGFRSWRLKNSATLPSLSQLGLNSLLSPLAGRHFLRHSTRSGSSLIKCKSFLNRLWIEDQQRPIIQSLIRLRIQNANLKQCRLMYIVYANFEQACRQQANPVYASQVSQVFRMLAITSIRNWSEIGLGTYLKSRNPMPLSPIFPFRTCFLLASIFQADWDNDHLGLYITIWIRD